MTNILLLSGGNDSMYILNKYKQKKFIKIYFNYGQPYANEEIKRLPKNTKIINLTNLKIRNNGFVEGRNLCFLIEIAKMFSSGDIFMGSNIEDNFSDNKKKYLRQAIKIINESFGSSFKIKLPLANLTKREIMNYIIDKKINTYSCYKGRKIPCGKCKACLSVKNATRS